MIRHRLVQQQEAAFLLGARRRHDRHDITLRVGYSGQFSASGTTHGGTLKFSRSF